MVIYKPLVRYCCRLLKKCVRFLYTFRQFRMNVFFFARKEMIKKLNIFLCYAHADKVLLDELKAHLKPLGRYGLVTLWHDGDITPGTDWAKEIKLRLNKADIVLLLISADFIRSDYCYSVEMQQAIERYQAGKIRVIPIITRPVDWQDTPIGGITLGSLQALPKGAKPVTRWKNRDEAWVNVARGITSAANEWLGRSSIGQSARPRVSPLWRSLHTIAINIRKQRKIAISVLVLSLLLTIFLGYHPSRALQSNQPPKLNRPMQEENNILLEWNINGWYDKYNVLIFKEKWGK
jgi:hypothetical protein